ncbi:unnamed protein product [Rotaria sordida]|uniref:Uncharacterized protein n=1 Tax=Rotaria sordida TaxID=392033 RepID=A0A814MJJ9_9BILA|nr:unnamed protein product [Rotaria sordida]
MGVAGNLEDAIADAMLKRIHFLRKENDGFTDSSLAAELKWCLIWNKVDDARQNVFADYVFENITPSQGRQEFIKSVAPAAIIEALCQDNVSFVHLLMENGVSMKDLNIEQLTAEELKMFCAKTLRYSYKSKKTNKRIQRRPMLSYRPILAYDTTSESNIKYTSFECSDRNVQ